MLARQEGNNDVPEVGAGSDDDNSDQSSDENNELNDLFPE